MILLFFCTLWKLYLNLPEQRLHLGTLLWIHAFLWIMELLQRWWIPFFLREVPGSANQEYKKINVTYGDTVARIKCMFITLMQGIFCNYLVENNGINNWSLSSTSSPSLLVVIAEIKHLLEIWATFFHRIGNILVDSKINLIWKLYF